MAGVRRKSQQMREIERRTGHPIEQAMLAALNSAGSFDRAAAELGVNPKTFANWMVRYGIRRKNVYVLDR